MGEGVGDRGSRAGGFAAAAVAEATRLEEEDEGRRALRRCGRVRWAGGKGFAQGKGIGHRRSTSERAESGIVGCYLGWGGGRRKMSPGQAGAGGCARTEGGATTVLDGREKAQDQRDPTGIWGAGPERVC